MDEINNRKAMNAREFFYLVANMRQAQKNYFKTRDKGQFAICRALENDVDREISRVKSIVETNEN